MSITSSETSIHSAIDTLSEPNLADAETYEELFTVLTVLGNGAYAQRRIELMQTDEDRFAAVKELERDLLNGVGMHSSEEALDSEAKEKLATLVDLLSGANSRQQIHSTILGHLRGIGKSVRSAFGIA